MKFSENWLRTLVDPPADRDALVRRLTMAGLEVEAVTPLGDGLDHVVVGEIVACEKHPNADKLRVCAVDVGTGAPLAIVCGAPNARVGLKAPVALVGATLPGGLAIRQATLRGVESSGMLCSAKELAIDADASGLMELPPDAPVGTAIATYLALPDATLELKLTPNRPDCLGLRGLASEVATLFDVPQKPLADEVVTIASEATRAVRLDAPRDCPRYVGRVIEGIDATAKTPLWLAERLRRAGLRPISAVVDCTNYVMLELGQPTHAFDHDRVDGTVVVRRASANEKLRLLDERDVALSPDFVVIADARGALAAGGVMGGFDSRVTLETKNVFLEAAHFAPASIVGRARKLGLHTDASHRFERGVDPALPVIAMKRLTALLVAICGGKAGPLTIVEDESALPKIAPVHLRHARLEAVLGIRIDAARVESILRGLDMQVERDDARDDGETRWRVVAPSRRFDIAIEEDLIEEVARVHGYDHVPAKAPGGLLVVAPEREGIVPASAVRRAMIARDYAEAINFSFVPAALLEAWGQRDGAPALANPLSADLAVMRTTLLPGLVEAVRRNLARQQTRVRLFELGRVFPNGGGERGEVLHLAAAAIGTAGAEQWATPARALDFFDVKGDLESLLALAGDGGFAFAPADAPWLHPGRAASVLRDGTPIGVVGALHPRLLKALGFDHDVVVFEIALDAALRRGVARARDLSRFPMVRRDIAVVLPVDVPAAAVATTVKDAAGARLRDLLVFDEYRGKGLPDGARSLAIGLILQDDYRTLTDQDADAAVADAVSALDRKFGAKLRS